jgi:hypothetical protein
LRPRFGFKWFTSKTNLPQLVEAVKEKIGLKSNQFTLQGRPMKNQNGAVALPTNCVISPRSLASASTWRTAARPIW